MQESLITGPLSTNSTYASSATADIHQSGYQLTSRISIDLKTVRKSLCVATNLYTYSLSSEYMQEGHWRQLHEDDQYLEGWKVAVTVSRDSDDSDHWLTVAFATSDLTARGIDSDAYRECSALPVNERTPVSCCLLVYILPTLSQRLTNISERPLFRQHLIETSSACKY